MKVRLFVVSLLLACAAAMLSTAPAFASPDYLVDVETTYPAVVGSRIDVCQICHVNADPNTQGTTRNSYGLAFRNAGHSLTAIESADSDGDTYTNLAEIAALTFPGNAADHPVVASTGSLTVTILPAGAVTAGAQWRVGTGAYQSSGATVAGLAVGSASVNFKSVTGWTTPADQSATITAGGTASATGTYVQLSLIPNVVGQTQAAASTAITGAGLTVGAITQAFSASVPSGTVISQSLAAGGYVAPGTAVALTVSKGPQPVTVPNVVGLTQAAASTAITGASLTVGTVTQAYSASVPSGTVIDQTPAAGGSVAPGTAVALTVSKGPQPIIVPNVVGQTEAAAGTLILGTGLVVGSTTQEYSATVPAGTVIRQTPTAGTSVSPSTAVSLTVSKGPQPVVTGSIIINRGAWATNSSSVTLGLTWSANAVRMCFSDNGTNWSAWEPLKATRAYSLPAGNGYRTVRVQFLDIANNRSPVYSDYIIVDTVAPTGSISINGGAQTTSSASVTLNLASADPGSGVQSMRFSTDGMNWTLWEPVAAAKALTLPGPAGAYNTVRVQYRDSAGNYSPVYSDYIFVQAL